MGDQEKLRDPVEFVRRLLAMRDFFDSVVVGAFRSEKKFQKGLKQEFEVTDDVHASIFKNATWNHANALHFKIIE
jgi:cullin 3